MRHSVRAISASDTYQRNVPRLASLRQLLIVVTRPADEEPDHSDLVGNGGLEERSVGFKSLQEGIDTTTSGGKLVFHIFGALAEFERSLTKERTHAGLKAARARGRNGG